MKGSVGTSTYITTIKDPRKKFKKGKRGFYFCVECRKNIRKGYWATPLPRRLYKHSWISECKRQEEDLAKSELELS